MFLIYQKSEQADWLEEALIILLLFVEPEGMVFLILQTAAPPALRLEVLAPTSPSLLL